MKKLLTLLLMVVLTQVTFSQFNPWTIKNNRIYPKDPSWKLSDTSFTKTPSDSNYVSAQLLLRILYSDTTNSLLKQWIFVRDSLYRRAQEATKIPYSDTTASLLKQWIFVRDSLYRAAQEAAIRADSSNQVRAYMLWDKGGSWLQIAKGSRLFFAKSDTSSSGGGGIANVSDLNDSLTTGNHSTYLGKSAGNKSTGGFNTSFGYQADYSIHSAVTGSTTFGAQANWTDTTGNNCSFFGYQAGYGNIAEYTTGFGSEVLFHNKGEHNTAFGYMSLYQNSIGHDNTGVGHYTLWNLFDGYGNDAVGSGALQNLLNANKNTAIGYQALFSLTYTDNNIGIGYHALYADTSGSQNVAVGPNALADLVDGWGNTGVGLMAGYSGANYNTSHSTFIGAYSGPSANGRDNSTAIGYQAAATKDNQVVLGNASIIEVLTTGDVKINSTTHGIILKDSAGKFWRVTVSTLGVVAADSTGLN